MQLQTLNLSTEKPSLFSEVIFLTRVVLIVPETFRKGTSSTLKRTKTLTRSTMRGGRTNNLVMINIYHSELDEITTELIKNKFNQVKQCRIATFG